MHTKLEQHLAIATGAVSAAAVPLGADAAIVYKDNTNAFSISYGDARAEWDIDGASGYDFLLFTTTFNSTLSWINLASNGGINGRGLVASQTGNKRFNNIPVDLAVGSTLSGYVWNGSGSIAYGSILSGSAPPTGNFGFQGAALGSNYIGYRFLSGPDMLYGWAELILSTTGGGTVTVNRWAYNDTPDGSIKVGDTGPQDVPTPPTLALLAAGAFGLRRWRAQRAAA